MSSFQGVGIKVYRGVLISGCWNRGVPLHTEMSPFQGIEIKVFHCVQRCPHFRECMLFDPTLLYLAPLMKTVKQKAN